MAENPQPDRDAPGRGASLSSLVHRPDLLITGAIVAVCGLLYFLTTQFDQVPDILAQNVPAEWFPRLLIWTIVILSLILPFEHMFFEEGREHIDEERKARIEPMSMLTAGLLGITVLCITLFGTYVAMVLITIFLPLLWGERRLKIWVPYVILFPGGVMLLFTRFLKVFFEPGIVFSLFN